MPDPAEHADALHVVHTGAASHAAAQADAVASLGGFRASTRIGGLGTLLETAIPGIRIDHAASANLTADDGSRVTSARGTLTAVGDDELTWAAPAEADGAQGASVTIANAEQKVIEDGGDPNRYLLVSRVSSNPLSGGCGVNLTAVLTNAIGHDDADTESGPTYRAVGFLATADVTNLKIWIASHDHPVSIALENPASEPNGAVQAIANETTAPTGLTFVAPDAEDHADVLTVASLDAGEWVAIWIKRDLSAETDPSAWSRTEIAWSFDGADTVSRNGSAAGIYRLRADGTAAYELYLGIDAAPDFTSPPVATAAPTFVANDNGKLVPTLASPIIHTPTPPLSGTSLFRYVLRLRNEWGLLSANLAEWTLRLDAAGNQIAIPPSDASDVIAAPAAAGTVHLTARYNYFADGTLAADTWLIYLAEGADPDPDLDTPLEVEMAQADGVAKLDYTSSAYTEGADVRAIVRTRRSGTPDVDSTSVTVVSATATLLGPAAPAGDLFVGNVATQA
jgi:hypothetical protein